ncbi:MAG: dTDP-4-dehydrorhamnose 3,5-epimerase [Candidatus Lambdaproteobacteria bacterium RIFOXYD2_FULL_50_16]|uniref:dTDP-4-dehydrorhamnose 3,5-epimerase n=1 Tax=Candidatus Lambdaproteobacteria bacterium RIFOXYD2_FULL_50_16 TaxID=1817772 RepID=A0A1F6GET4_9PROT|nr:MAG: dTDP-4-dehydrorhamnose 3,5-epimerase [Candidatus Lambdaproteobacteria bacterium RIFOXYD2_FULL_50_16]
MIEGVKITPLRQIPDERGKIMHMLRSTDAHFMEFGEIYFSCVHPGAIKAWHIHTKMTLNYAVPHGRIKFVLHDDREGSPTKGETQEVFMGADNYCLVTVPPLVWNGFKGYGPDMAIVANCATLAHDPGEISRRPHDDQAIGYDWDLKHG